jgi:uncharacterized protein (UPF0332 family)
MTSEQAALLQKARDSLKAAELLAHGGLYGFSASRSYYSMFYVVEALLLGEELSFSKHAAVIAAFGKLFVKRGTVPAEYHRFLIEAEDSRNVGDYDSGTVLSEEEAGKQMKRAAQFLDLAERLIPSGSPNTLRFTSS